MRRTGTGAACHVGLLPKERGPVPVRIQTRAAAQSRNRIIPSRNKAIASGLRAFNRSGRFRRIVHTGPSSVTTTAAASTWLPTGTSFHFRRGSKSGKNLPNCTGRSDQLLIHELSNCKLGQFATEAGVLYSTKWKLRSGPCRLIARFILALNALHFRHAKRVSILHMLPFPFPVG